jgi:FHA domain protein
MALPLGPWRLTYTPGQWLILAGPRLVTVMQPAPPKMSTLVGQLWTDMQAAGSLGSLMELLRGYSLDQMPDFAAFVWDGGALHGLARGRIAVVDANTGQTALDGEGALTWHEGHFGAIRALRIDMGLMEPDHVLHLPLITGAVGASSLVISTDPDQLVRFPDENNLLPEPIAPAPSLPSEPLEPAPAPEPSMNTSIDSGRHVEDSQFQRPEQSFREEEYAPFGIGIQVNTGEFTNVSGGLVIGRAPDAGRGPMGSGSLRVPSPGNDISRSHLLIEPVGREARVTDLNSTNGTTVQPAGEEPYLLENGDSVTVSVGTVLNLGDGVSLRIERAR